MKTKNGSIQFLITCLVLAAPSIARAQQEAVTGAYDSKNDWFTFEWFNPQTGKHQTIYDSSNKVKPSMHASASFDSASGAYTYSYQVTNLAGAAQLLDDISVKHSSDVFGAVAPAPQDEWYSTEDQGKNAWSWSKIGGSVRGIPAGQTVNGFSFKSKGLPAIVGSWFSGERRAKFHFPSPDNDTPEVQASFGRVFRGIKTQYAAKFVDGVQQKTVGPSDPPATFDAASAIQNLIALVNQSRAQGWIDSDPIKTSLLAKLNNVASKVGTDKATAKNVLGAFLNDVSAQNGKHLTTEAYALLYFNAQYAVIHL